MIKFIVMNIVCIMTSTSVWAQDAEEYQGYQQQQPPQQYQQQQQQQQQRQPAQQYQQQQYQGYKPQPYRGQQQPRYGQRQPVYRNQQQPLYHFAGTIGLRYNTVTIENLATTATATVTNKMAIGFHLGGLAYYKFMENLSARSGLVLVDRGFNITVDTAAVIPFVPATSSELKYSLLYIDIPLNAIYSFGQSGFYGVGGFLFGLKMSSSCTNASGTCTFDANGTNFIFNIGAGYHVTELMGKKVDVELQYEHGLSDIDTGTTNAYTRDFVLSGVVHL